MDNQLIIGLLSGSLGTMIFKEIFNQINKKVDFKRDLTKHVYEKKIDAAEKAISFYSSYLNFVIEIRESFKVIKKSIEADASIDYEVLQEIININRKRLTKLFAKSYSEMNIVNLYFDLNDEDEWNEDDIQELYLNLSEFKMYDTEIVTLSNLLTQHNENGEGELVEYYSDQIEIALNEYLSSIEKLIKSYSRNKSAVDGAILKLKNQIKKRTGL